MKNQMNVVVILFNNLIAIEDKPICADRFVQRETDDRKLITRRVGCERVAPHGGALRRQVTKPAEKGRLGIKKLDNVNGIKLDTQVDEITGSTVSSNGVYGAVKNAISAYEKIGMGGNK